MSAQAIIITILIGLYLVFGIMFLESLCYLKKMMKENSPSLATLMVVLPVWPLFLLVGFVFKKISLKLLFQGLLLSKIEDVKEAHGIKDDRN